MTEELDGGRKLVDRLIDGGFDVPLAFWVKETEAGQWFLYITSPVVDAEGPAAAYRVVLPVVRSMPELGIDQFAIKVVGVNDSMTAAAREVVQPKVPDGPFAVRSPKPYAGITRFGGSTMGGVSVDGAYIWMGGLGKPNIEQANLIARRLDVPIERLADPAPSSPPAYRTPEDRHILEVVHSIGYQEAIRRLVMGAPAAQPQTPPPLALPPMPPPSGEPGRVIGRAVLPLPGPAQPTKKPPAGGGRKGMPEVGLPGEKGGGLGKGRGDDA